MDPVTFDSIIVRIGDLGFFQKRLLIYITLIVMVTSSMTYLPMFILTTPKHRCALDGVANDTYRIQSSDHLELVNASIPLDSEGQWSSCYLFRPISSNVTRNQSAGSEERGQTQNQETQCGRWVYDRHYFDTSIIEDLNLVCDNQDIRTHANMAMMMGKLVSAILQGTFSDIFGRKRCLVGLIVVMIVSSFANVFIFNVPSLLIARFSAGFSATSLYLCVYVLGLECLSPSRRRLYSVLLTVMWVLGGFALTGVAFFIRDSFTLMLSLAVPMIGYLVFIWLIPESPRWLMSKGRMDEARSVLEKVASVNKKPFPHAIFEKVAVTEFVSKSETSHEISMVAMVEDESSHVAVSQPPNTESFKALLSNSGMLRRFAILLFNWIVNSLVYYALLFNVANLAGSMYLNFLLLNCVDLLSCTASYFVIERFGRKLSYGGFLLIANMGCLATLLPHFLADGERSSTAIIILGLVGRAGVSTSFSILYLYTAELIPTTHRNKMMGAFSMCSRVGAILAPYIADLGIMIGGPMKEVLPLIVCGVTGLIASCLALILPETAGTILPNNIQEALECRRKSPKSSESLRKGDLK